MYRHIYPTYKTNRNTLQLQLSKLIGIEEVWLIKLFR